MLELFLFGALNVPSAGPEVPPPAPRTLPAVVDPGVSPYHKMTPAGSGHSRMTANPLPPGVVDGVAIQPAVPMAPESIPAPTGLLSAPAAPTGIVPSLPPTTAPQPQPSSISPFRLTSNPFRKAKQAEPPKPGGETVEATVPALPPVPDKAEAEKEEEEEATSGDRWPFMRLVQGTWPGRLLDDSGLMFYGWVDSSYNASSAAQNNSPVVWNDRANEFMMQQAWVRFEKPVVTSGTTTPTFGFRSDWIYGTDYRFTLQRGWWNSQLENANGNQNLYGFDMLQLYGEGYFPTLGLGTGVKVGKFFTPFGVESIEAVSSPLASKSYAFNWCPPFTHWGVLATTQLTSQFKVQYGAVNGNDVTIGDPSEEWRFLGTAGWTSADGSTAVTLGTSFGRGKFNSDDPFNPATIGLQTEPAGRNNINVFDLVISKIATPKLTFLFETIYGYQYDVPANVPGGIIKQDAVSGTAHWGSMVGYGIYQFTPQVSGIVRLEAFDDFEGQRTGFEGVYYAATAGINIKPKPCVIIRPEIRYDYNDYSRPFEGGKHWLFTATADVILRY